MQVREGAHGERPARAQHPPCPECAPLRGDESIPRVVIVGGGPAGCALARALDDAVIIEEHSRIGEPVQCAGLVGKTIFSMTSQESVVNVIDGARIFLGEESFFLEKKQAAFVVDRAAFDRELAQGLEVRCGTKYLSSEVEKNGVHVHTSGGDLTCDYLVGADGPLSSVRSSFSLSPHYHTAVQYTVEGEFDPHRVELHIAQPFFYYIVPENESKARVGCIHPYPRPRLDAFIEWRGFGRVLSRTGGIIPIGRGRIASERVALIGDAACQTKPLTGGGLYYGLKASGLLARAISKGRLSLYEKSWNDTFGREIRASLLLRKIYERMGEREIRAVFEVLKHNTRRLELCDFERHATIVSRLALAPSTLTLLPLFARMILKEIFL